MHLLLDTHLLIWAMGSPQRLPSGLADMPLLSTDPASTWNLACCAAPYWKGAGRNCL